MAKLENPQHEFVHTINGTVYFDWQSAGFKPQGWPAALKDSRIEGVVEVGSLCAHFGDPWVNPASGGVIGMPYIAAKLQMTGRQVQNEIRCGSADSIRRAGRLHASNLGSLDAFRELNRTGRTAAWSENSPFTSR